MILIIFLVIQMVKNKNIFENYLARYLNFNNSNDILKFYMNIKLFYFTIVII